jgi:hypothetical protein
MIHESGKIDLIRVVVTNSVEHPSLPNQNTPE